MNAMCFIYGLLICFTIFAIMLMVKLDYNSLPNGKKIILRLFAGAPLIFAIWTHIQDTSLTTARLLFLIGFIFFILGDVLINFGLAFGLVSFLVGHIIFGIGIISSVKSMFVINQLWSMLFIFAAIIFWYITNYYRDVSSKDKIIGYASVVYVASIGFAAAMFIPALVQTNTAIATYAGIGFLGYILFYASDIEIVVNEFVKPVRNDFLINSVLYYTALIFLIIFTLFI